MRINFDIPTSIQDGLDSGKLIRRGGVVYNRSGGIVIHLKEAPEFDEGEVPLVDDDFEVDDFAVNNFEGDDSSLGAGVALIGGLALVGLAVGAVGSVVTSSRDKKERRRELEWRIAEARETEARAAIASRREAAPAGWYDDGSGRLRWWDGQEWTEHFHVGNPCVGAPAGWYDDGSGRQRWWDGQEWTEHFQGSQRGAPSTARSAVTGASLASSWDLEVAFETPAVSMSASEWQERVRAMLLARAISDVQWRLLSNARIVDADSALLDWQSELRRLTPQQFSDLINQILVTNPKAREEALEAASAGWYDDGSGQQRWWDGASWTEQFQTAPMLEPATQHPSVPAGWYDDGWGGQRWWDGRQWTGPHA